MKQREFYFGPGAASLLLVIVMVSMSVLGLLALISVRADVRLAERSRDFDVAEFETMAAAERTMAELDAILASSAARSSTEEDYQAAIVEALPQDMTLKDGEISWVETSELGRSLQCRVKVMRHNEKQRFVWMEHAFVSEDSDDYFLK